MSSEFEGSEPSMFPEFQRDKTDDEFIKLIKRVARHGSKAAGIQGKITADALIREYGWFCAFREKRTERESGRKKDT